MGKRIVSYDIETIGRPDISADVISSLCKIGNLTDPIKIEKKQAEFKSKLGANPLFAMAICGGWYSSERDCGYISLEETSPEAEKKFLEEYWNKLSEFDVLVGFNSIGFDSRILLLRSAVHQVEIPFGLSRKKYDTTGYHIDLYLILTDYASYGQGSLDFFLSMFGLNCKTEGINGSMVQGMWDDGKHAEIGEYCVQDCRQTLALFERAKGYFL